jgi:Mn2+/Fe2+ NRAMP family transporter
VTGTTQTPARRRSRTRLLALAATLGPGLIAASAGNDAGGILTYANAGAQFGYSPLFLMVLITVGLVLVQEMCTRLGAYTGQGLGSLMREQFPLRSTATALGLLYVANAGLTVSEFAGIGAASEMLGLSRYVTVPLAAVALWVVTVPGSYARGERLAILLSLAFLAYPISALLAHPDPHAVAAGLLTPQFPHTTVFLVAAVGLIGTTISPYMQFYVSSAVVDKKIGPEQYPAERFDTISGAILSDVVSIFIIIATAAAIGGRGPLASASEAAEALRPVAGDAAPVLFAVGLLGASLLAAAVVPLSSAYAVAEAAGRERSVSAPLSRAPLFYGLFTVQLVIGAAAALAPANLVQLAVSMQVLNGVITPVLLVYVLVLANRRRVLGAAANGPVFRVVATACVAVIAVMAAAVVVLRLAGVT